jgi:hypothetical protein
VEFAVEEEEAAEEVRVRVEWGGHGLRKHNAAGGPGGIVGYERTAGMFTCACGTGAGN